MKLRLCGYFPKNNSKEKRLGRYAIKQSLKIIPPNSKIKSSQLTFMKHSANWENGFQWIIKRDKIEILIPRKYKDENIARWLIRHELRHAKQMLEGRLNKSLNLVKFKDRKGKTRHFKWGYDGEYHCLESGRLYKDLPWEEEVLKDDKYCR